MDLTWIFLFLIPAGSLLKIHRIQIIQFLQHILLWYSKICLILPHKQVFKIKTLVFRYSKTNQPRNSIKREAPNSNLISINEKSTFTSLLYVFLYDVCPKERKRLQ